MLDLPRPFFNGTAALVGAMIGSFLNVVIVRLPKGESIVRPRSKCPTCGDAIPAWLNVPVLSWLVLRGRCRACKTPISVRYPIVELLTALLFLAVAIRFGPTIAAVLGWLLAGALIAITFIDLDRWEIPDEISLSGIVLGAALRPFAFETPWFDGVYAALLGAGALWLLRWLFFVVRGVEGMGLGDAKLLAMIGAFLGRGALLTSVLVGAVVGSIIGLLLLVAHRKDGAVLQGEAPPPMAAEPTSFGLVPDWICLAGIAAATIGRALFLAVPWYDALYGAALGAGTLYLMRELAAFVQDQEPADLGDAKLAALIGAIVGPTFSVPIAAAGAVAGTIRSIFGSKPDPRGAADAEDDWTPPRNALPFGPFLALGALAELLMGPILRRLFFGLFG